MHENTSVVNQPKSSQNAVANEVVPVQEPSALETGKTLRFPIFKKSTVGTTNDPFEREADTMADKRMRRLETSFIQRKAAAHDPDDYDDEHVRLKPLASQVTPFIQAKGDGGGAVSDSVSSQIKGSMGGGNVMDGGTKSFMESRFGADLSDVKIHNSDESAQLSQALNAKAFTVSNNIYFNKDQYQPGTDAGKHLLAHELTHTFQQGAAIKRTPKATETHEKAPQMPKQNTLKRTLYVVQNAVWNTLPTVVKAGAEQELNRVFAFVGKENGETPFTIRVLAPDQLPEQFDFSESIVSVVTGDASSYFEKAFALQQKQVEDWLAQQGVLMSKSVKKGPGESEPGEPIGKGGHAKGVVKSNKNNTFAISKMIGVVDLQQAMNTFIEQLPPVFSKQMMKLRDDRFELNKWPAISQLPICALNNKPPRFSSTILCRFSSPSKLKVNLFFMPDITTTLSIRLCPKR